MAEFLALEVLNHRQIGGYVGPQLVQDSLLLAWSELVEQVEQLLLLRGIRPI